MAAWAIEDTPQDLSLIYRTMGRKGLESIENAGPRMAETVESCSMKGPATPFDKLGFRVYNLDVVGPVP